MGSLLVKNTSHVLVSKSYMQLCNTMQGAHWHLSQGPCYVHFVKVTINPQKPSDTAHRLASLWFASIVHVTVPYLPASVAHLPALLLSASHSTHIPVSRVKVWDVWTVVVVPR